MDVNDLMRVRENKRAEARTVLGAETLTAEAEARATALLDEADGLDKRITAMQRAIGPADPTAPIDAGELERRANEGKPFTSFGEQLKAVSAASGMNPQVDRRLYAVKAAATGMSENVPSDGGFLVQSDYGDTLVKSAYDASEIAARCRMFEISANSDRISIPFIEESSRATGSRWGGVQAYWEPEADTATSKKPKIGEMEIKLAKLLAFCYATEELLKDAKATESVIRQAFAEEMAFMLDDAVIRGNGAGKPLGILNASGVLVSVAKETGQAADSIVYENVLKMWSRCHGRSRKNAVWYYNQDCEPQLYSMSMAVGTSGVPVFMPAGGLSGLPYATLFARPLLPIEQADTVGDQGDIMLCAMDQYALIRKGGVQAAESIHVQFLTAQTVFRFMYRVNGQPLWKSYLTPFQSANTLSPFVVLDARA